MERGGCSRIDLGSRSLSGRRQSSLQRRRHPHHYSTHIFTRASSSRVGSAGCRAQPTRQQVLSSSSYLCPPSLPYHQEVTEHTGSDAQQSPPAARLPWLPLIPTLAELSEAACHKSLGRLQMQTLGSRGFTSRWHLSSPSSTEEAVPTEHELF